MKKKPEPPNRVVFMVEGNDDGKGWRPLMLPPYRTRESAECDVRHMKAGLYRITKFVPEE